MTSELNYQILGCDTKIPELEEWGAEYTNRYIGLSNYDQAGDLFTLKIDDLHSCVGVISFCHLGYPFPEDPLEYLENGFSTGVAFFSGDWWKGDEDARMSMDKSHPEWYPQWARAFQEALLLGLLSERWDELDQVCNWVEASLDPGYIGDTKADYEMVKIHLSVAASLRKKPMPGLEEMEQDLLNSKQKYPIMLLEAWQAARNDDQEGFEKGLIAALKRVSSKRSDKDIPIEWLAPNESIVALAARKLGMTIPELPPKLNALLITPESIGVK